MGRGKDNFISLFGATRGGYLRGPEIKDEPIPVSVSGQGISFSLPDLRPYLDELDRTRAHLLIFDPVAGNIVLGARLCQEDPEHARAYGLRPDGVSIDYDYELVRSYLQRMMTS